MSRVDVGFMSRKRRHFPDASGHARNDCWIENDCAQVGVGRADGNGRRGTIAVHLELRGSVPAAVVLVVPPTSSASADAGWRYDCETCAKGEKPYCWRLS